MTTQFKITYSDGTEEVITSDATAETIFDAKFGAHAPEVQERCSVEEVEEEKEEE